MFIVADLVSLWVKLSSLFIFISLPEKAIHMKCQKQQNKLKCRLLQILFVLKGL